MSDAFGSTIPITKPVLTKEYYERLTPKQKTEAGESFFLSLYLNQIYNAKSPYEDEEIENEEDEKFLDTTTQFDLVQQQYNKVLADSLARKGVLGFDKILNRNQSIHPNQTASKQ